MRVTASTCAQAVHRLTVSGDVCSMLSCGDAHPFSGFFTYTMTFRTLLPELGQSVINQLGSEEGLQDWFGRAHYLHALRNCALTCKDWLRWSRVHLYRTVHADKQLRLELLRTTLAANPSLGNLVRTVKATIDAGPNRSIQGVVLHELLLFIQVYCPQLRGIEMIFHSYPYPSLSFNNPSRFFLYTPRPCLRRLRAHKMLLSSLLFLLRALPCLCDLECHFIEMDSHHKIVYPKQMALTYLLVSIALIWY